MVTKLKRRNISTYKTEETLTEEDIKNELANIDLLKHQLLNKLNSIQEISKYKCCYFVYTLMMINNYCFNFFIR